MKAIVFGANGQDGFYLMQLLKEQNITVIGVSRNGENILIGDVSDLYFVEQLIKSENPDFIFHLAANSTTSHLALFENHETISKGSMNVLETIYKFNLKAKVFLSGSGLQFENKGLPIKETDAFHASSPYAVDRIYSTYLARYYRKLGLKVYVGYFFNHESPRRSVRHVSQMVVTAAKKISNGSSEKITIGDLNVEKEWTFAGDIVRAIWILVNQENIFECNIGSGKSYSIEEWIVCCFKEIGKNWRDYIIQKDNFKSEYKILISDSSLIRSLGWSDTTSLRELAKNMLHANQPEK